MNKIQLSIVALISTSFFSLAQTNTVKYGFKGGLDIFNYPIEEENLSVSKNYEIGFFVGAQVKFKVSEKISIQPELLLRRHKANEKISNLKYSLPNGIGYSSFPPTEIEVSDWIVQLPTITKYNLSNSIKLGLGPQFSYIINRKFETTEKTININSQVSEEAVLTSVIDYDKFDVGLLFIIDYKIAEKVEVFTAYTFGFNERDNKINTSIIDVGLSYFIN